MSIDKRSLLATDYIPFYTRRYSYLHAEIEARKRMIEEGITKNKNPKKALDYHEIMGKKEADPSFMIRLMKNNVKNRLADEGLDLDLGKYYNKGLEFIQKKKT